MASLLNRAQVKRFILAAVTIRRPELEGPYRITRVSRESLDAIEAHLRSYIEGLVAGHPSRGKTFKP